jgi:hypothetical protein
MPPQAFACVFHAAWEDSKFLPEAVTSLNGHHLGARRRSPAPHTQSRDRVAAVPEILAATETNPVRPGTTQIFPGWVIQNFQAGFADAAPRMNNRKWIVLTSTCGKPRASRQAGFPAGKP